MFAFAYGFIGGVTSTLIISNLDLTARSKNPVYRLLDSLAKQTDNAGIRQLASYVEKDTTTHIFAPTSGSCGPYHQSIFPETVSSPHTREILKQHGFTFGHIGSDYYTEYYNIDDRMVHASLDKMK